MRKILAAFAFLWLLGACSNGDRELPYLGKHESISKMVDGEEIIDTVYHRVPEFELIDQDSTLFTHNEVKGKVFVADFFFTSCPSICPVMTDQLVRLQKMTNELDGFMILSHTVDPERDTPERLSKYAEKYRCDLSNWHFLNGDRAMVYELGMDGYFLSMGEAPDSPGGFIHSPTFVLVDQLGHIRGMYDGTKANEVAQLAEDVKLLLKRP